MSQCEVWRIQDLHGGCVQSVNQVLAHDLIGTVLIGCKIYLIWNLAGFHFLVPKLYANLVLAHDLVETVLICWYSAKCGCEIHNLVIVTSIILWNLLFGKK